MQFVCGPIYRDVTAEAFSHLVNIPFTGLRSDKVQV